MRDCSHLDLIDRSVAPPAVVADHHIPILAVAPGLVTDVTSVKSRPHYSILALDDKELDRATVDHVGVEMGLVIVKGGQG